MGEAREPGVGPTWGERAQLPGLASVVDPADLAGLKNALIDRVHRAALDVVDRARGQRILDFGSGTGRLTDWLQALGADVLGVDASPEMIGAARSAVPSGKFELLESGRIPADDGSFDTALSVWVLQYFVTEAAALETISRELTRVLAPGGRLVAIEQVQHGGLERGGSLDTYATGFAAAGLTTTTSPIRVSDSRIVGRAARRRWTAALPGLERIATFEARRIRPETLTGGRYADYLFVGTR